MGNSPPDAVPSCLNTLNFSLHDAAPGGDDRLLSELKKEFWIFWIVALVQSSCKKAAHFLRAHELLLMAAVVATLSYHMTRQKQPSEEAEGQCRDPSLPPPLLDVVASVGLRVLVLVARLRLLSQLARGQLFEPFFGYDEEQ
jgi:hypothetical protein